MGITSCAFDLELNISTAWRSSEDAPRSISLMCERPPWSATFFFCLGQASQPLLDLEEGIEWQISIPYLS
jgi:hypothetical protein